jgi:serine/threonine-protein kinase
MIGETLNDRYRIIDNFSIGMYGQTYLAEDMTEPGSPKCIIRRLQLHNKGEAARKYIQDMLKKKLEALSEVNNHDQIPSIISYFSDNDSFYLVEEYVSGHPLADELEPYKPLPEEKVIAMMQEVLEVLAFMHHYSLTHQYIQPTTLIRRETDNKIVLTGSGVMREVSAQLVKSQIQTHQTLLMHPSTIYTPIEQTKGHTQLNSDIYALGMVAIQALSGLPTNVLSRIKHQNGSSNGDLVWQDRVEASAGLIAILERMVHPDYSRRYQLAREVLSDLKALASVDQPLSSTNLSTDDALEMAPSESESEELPELQVDESTTEPQASRPLMRLYAMMGIVIAMVIGGTMVALLGRQLLQASGNSDRPSQSTTNAGGSGQMGKPDRTANSSQASGNSTGDPALPESEALFQEGQAQVSNGKPQDAIASFTRVIQLEPENAKAYYLRGNVRMTLGDHQNAIKDYNEAIRLNPDLTVAYVNRGSARADLGDDQAAIADYTRAIELDKTLAASYLNRCLSRSNIGDQTGAIEDCTQAISLQPDNVLAYQNRGLARRRLGEPQTAIQDFNIAMKLNPEDADSYYNRGLARRELGDYPGAILDYSKAIKLHPGHALALYDRGLAKLEQGDAEGALADLQQSATLCLNAGRITCYNDAQYHIKQLQSQLQSQL